MEDSDLEAIRAKRMAEMQQQLGVSKVVQGHRTVLTMDMSDNIRIAQFTCHFDDHCQSLSVTTVHFIRSWE